MLSPFSRFLKLLLPVVAARPTALWSLSFLLLCCSGVSSASTITFYYAIASYWGPLPTIRHSSAYGLCAAGWPAEGDRRIVDNANCQIKTPSDADFRSVGLIEFGSENCPFGNTGLTCNTSCDAPNTMVDGQCVAPVTPTCPEGAYYDFESSSCKYPQDDTCSQIGASWNPATGQCDCGASKLLTGSGSMLTCVDKANDEECTAASSDYSGYFDQTAICAGRNRCPNGGKPGFVNVGDGVQAVCMGGEDPRCPGGNGGTFNGEFRCTYDPDDQQDPRCPPGSTPGYVGPGDSSEFTCVPDDYLPETCPPGQYAWNEGTGGFACVTASDNPPPTDLSGNPTTPGKVGGSSTSTTDKTDAAGNPAGTETTESEFNLDFSSLLQDAPADNFKNDLDDFSDAKIDGLQLDDIAGEFSGQDGAFTERSSLNSASDFIKQHTIGTSTSCSGNFPFFGYAIPCEKFTTFNRIFGWFLFVLSAFYIYETLTRPSPS